jgi:uncharacterized membrane protein
MMLRRLRHHRPRLLAAAIVGPGVYLLLPATLSFGMRFIVAWDIAVALFLVLMLILAARATPQTLRLEARLEDERAWVILALVVAAALASLVAIGSVLHDAKDLQGLAAAGPIGLAGATILLSWLLAHTMFALHYARAYYDDPPGTPTPPRRQESDGKDAKIAGGLDFPHEAKPDFWDFLYFSFVIGMTCQVSDVQVGSRRMRRLALGHGLIAFLFNTVILALSINLLAGLL